MLVGEGVAVARETVATRRVLWYTRTEEIRPECSVRVQSEVEEDEDEGTEGFYSPPSTLQNEWVRNTSIQRFSTGGRRPKDFFLYIYITIIITL